MLLNTHESRKKQQHCSQTQKKGPKIKPEQISKVVLLALISLLKVIKSINTITPIHFKEVLEYSPPVGYRFEQFLPPSTNRVNPVITAAGQYILVVADQKSELFSIPIPQEYQIQPAIFFNNRIVLNTPQNTSVIDISYNHPFRRALPFKFKKLILGFGNYLYGVDYQGRGVVWDLQANRMLRNDLKIDQELRSDQCNYILILDSFFCKIINGRGRGLGFSPQVNNPSSKNRYLRIPVRKPFPPKIVYTTFRSNKAYNYPNKTILGCFADPLNFYCEFYNFRDNSTSIFAINDIKPFKLLSNYSKSFLPIPELKIVAVSLKNFTVNFYDLQSGGTYLASYSYGIWDQGASFKDNQNKISRYTPMDGYYLYNPSYSNFSNQMTWQVSNSKIVMLKFNFRYNIYGCSEFFQPAIGRCAKCDPGYKFLNKFTPICVKATPPRAKKTSRGIGVFLPSRFWSLEKVTELTQVRFKLKVNFTRKASETQFYEDFSIENNFYAYSLDLTNLSNFCTFSADVYPSFVMINVTFLQSTSRIRVRIKVRDSYRNGYSNIAAKPLNISLPSSEENGGSGRRRMQSLGATSNSDTESYAIPAVIVPKDQVERERMLSFFYFCRCLEAMMTLFLLVKSFFRGMRNSMSGLWFVQVIMAFQALSLFCFLPIYTYQWLDGLLMAVFRIFKNGFMNVHDFEVSRRLRYFSQNRRFGKVWEYQVDFTVLNKQFLESLLYLGLVLLSLVSAFLRKYDGCYSMFSSLSCFRRRAQKPQVGEKGSKTAENRETQIGKFGSDLTRKGAYLKEDEVSMMDEYDLGGGRPHGEFKSRKNRFSENQKNDVKNQFEDELKPKSTYKDSNIASVRQNIGLVIIVPQIFYTTANIYRFAFYDDFEFSKKDNYISMTLGVTTCLLILTDCLLSFNAPKFEEGSCLNLLIPRKNSAFYAFGTFVFKTRQSLRIRFAPIQTIAFLNMFKWPIFALILGISVSGPYCSSIAFLIWAFSYFLISTFLLFRGGFSSSIHCLIRITKELLNMIFFVLLYLCAADSVFEYLSMDSIYSISAWMITIYWLLWILELCFCLMITFEQTRKGSGGGLSMKDAEYLIDSGASGDQIQYVDPDSLETEEETTLRMKVKKLNPYDFWNFVRQNVGMGAKAGEADRFLTKRYMSNSVLVMNGPDDLKYASPPLSNDLDNRGQNRDDRSVFEKYVIDENLAEYHKKLDQALKDRERARSKDAESQTYRDLTAEKKKSPKKRSAPKPTMIFPTENTNVESVYDDSDNGLSKSAMLMIEEMTPYKKTASPKENALTRPQKGMDQQNNDKGVLTEKFSSTLHNPGVRNLKDIRKKFKVDPSKNSKNSRKGLSSKEGKLQSRAEKSSNVVTYQEDGVRSLEDLIKKHSHDFPIELGDLTAEDYELNFGVYKTKNEDQLEGYGTGEKVMSHQHNLASGSKAAVEKEEGQSDGGRTPVEKRTPGYLGNLGPKGRQVKALREVGKLGIGFESGAKRNTKQADHYQKHSREGDDDEVSDYAHQVAAGDAEGLEADQGQDRSLFRDIDWEFRIRRDDEN